MPGVLCDPHELLNEFSTVTWFPPVNGVEHYIKELHTLMKTNSMVSFGTKLRTYKKFMGKYEFTIKSYVTL